MNLAIREEVLPASSTYALATLLRLATKSRPVHLRDHGYCYHTRHGANTHVITDYRETFRISSWTFHSSQVVSDLSCGLWGSLNTCHMTDVSIGTSYIVSTPLSFRIVTKQVDRMSSAVSFARCTVVASTDQNLALDWWENSENDAGCGREVRKRPLPVITQDGFLWSGAQRPSSCLAMYADLDVS